MSTGYNNYNVETKFTDWKPFIENTQNELNDLEIIASKCYLDLQLINIFYARFRSYMATRWSYIDEKEEPELRAKLLRIGKQIFDVKYLAELNRAKDNKNYNNVKFTSAQALVLEELMTILEKVCVNFRKYKLLYYAEKIDEKERDEKTKGIAV